MAMIMSINNDLDWQLRWLLRLRPGLSFYNPAPSGLALCIVLAQSSLNSSVSLRSAETPVSGCLDWNWWWAQSVESVLEMGSSRKQRQRKCEEIVSLVHAGHSTLTSFETADNYFNTLPSSPDVMTMSESWIGGSDFFLMSPSFPNWGVI